MQHTSYFLISPTPELARRITDSGAPDLADLAEPMLWSANEPDRGMLSPAETELLAKLLFVDALRRERGAHPMFEALFGGLRPGEAGFNAFFTLRRTPLDTSVEEALSDALDEGTANTLLNELAAHQPRLAEYLRIARDRRATRARSA
jgi:hypothetical protein